MTLDIIGPFNRFSQIRIRFNVAFQSSAYLADPGVKGGVEG